MNSTTPDWNTYEGINMSNIFAPFYWGAVISFILSGITILQAYNYFPSHDRMLIQVLAAVMIALDVASTGFVSQALYYYVVPHFGSLIPLQSLVPTLAAECFVSVFITLISQTYFAWQIRAVKTIGPSSIWPKTIIPGLVMLFALVSFGAGLGCSVVMITHSRNILTDKAYVFVVLAGINKAGSAVADIIATIALCYQLAVSRTGIKQTDSMLNILMQYVVQRGVLITMIQTLILVIFLGTGTHIYWLAFHVNVTRLYANTFFAMLNGRQSLREKRVSTAFPSSGFASGGVSDYSGTVSFSHHSEVKFMTSDATTHGREGINIDKSVIIADM